MMYCKIHKSLIVISLRMSRSVCYLSVVEVFNESFVESGKFSGNQFSGVCCKLVKFIAC